MATNKAEVAIKPSISNNTFCSAALNIAPTIIAISKPPNVVSVCKTSCPFNVWCLIACLKVIVFCAKPVSSKPVPRPTHSSIGKPHITLIKQLADEVLPIPISPKPITLQPAAISTLAILAPHVSACSHCACVMAGWCKKLAVPIPILALIKSGCASNT